MSPQGAHASVTPSYGMYIDGRWVEAISGDHMTIVDPATEDVVATVAKGSAEDAEVAVQAARRAFDEGPWPRMTTAERAAVLRAAAVLVRERGDELARLETLQMGKLITAAAGEVYFVAEMLDYFAGTSLAHHGYQTEIGTSDTFASVTHEPVGVVAGITPWNLPLVLAAFKFAPALAVGNAVIMKPASISPLTTLEMARIFEEASMPPGVFQVVVGPGESVGDHLASSALVDMVTLTGSLEVGQRTMRNAAETVKKIGLELGGKSPNIVFADADFEAAVQGAMLAAFYNTGQVCCAGTRLLVERPIYDEFVAELVARATTMAIGPGVDEQTQMGPLSSAAQLRTVEKYVALGIDEGATLACGGRRIERKGYYYEPTVFVDVANSMRIAQEEIFGPVLCVMPFDDEAEAIRVANDTIYGLAAAVWTKDVAKASRVTRALRAGTVWVNTFLETPYEMPWGGFKRSGVGRELGTFGLEEFTEAKSVIVDRTGEPNGLYPAG